MATVARVGRGTAQAPSREPEPPAARFSPAAAGTSRQRLAGRTSRCSWTGGSVLRRGQGTHIPRPGTRAPRCSGKLRAAVRDAKRAGHAYVILDGTLIPIDRVAADRPFYSGKHKKHGMNLQVIASPDGDILWVSGALPGSVHDKKAE